MSPFTIAQFFAMGQSPEQMAWLALLLGITWPTTHGAVASLHVAAESVVPSALHDDEPLTV
jgi:hypothetical protein